MKITKFVAAALIGVGLNLSSPFADAKGDHKESRDRQTMDRGDHHSGDHRGGDHSSKPADRPTIDRARPQAPARAERVSVPGSSAGARPQAAVPVAKAAPAVNRGSQAAPVRSIARPTGTPPANAAPTVNRSAPSQKAQQPAQMQPSASKSAATPAVNRAAATSSAKPTQARQSATKPANTGTSRPQIASSAMTGKKLDLRPAPFKPSTTNYAPSHSPIGPAPLASEAAANSIGFGNKAVQPTYGA